MLVWVVDCNDRRRFDESKDEVHKFLASQVEPPNGKLNEVRALLVVANKSKKNGKIDAKRIAEKLQLGQLKCFADYDRTMNGASGGGSSSGGSRRREWLVMPAWRFERDSEQSPESKLGEANLWKGMKWLVHVGFIASPSSNGVMGFFSNLTG